MKQNVHKLVALQGSLGNETADMSDVTQAEDGSVSAFQKRHVDHERSHNQTRIGLIVPDLSNIGSDDANEAIKAQLDLISSCNYVDQTGIDGGNLNWLEFDLIIVGSDANYPFTTTNIDDLVTLKIPIIVVSSAAAIHMKMGHNAVANTGSVTDIYIETRGDRVMELVFGATGDQTIFSTGTVSSRLDMSDAQLSENLLATVGGGGGGTNAETVVGDLPYSDGSGTILTLDDNTELPAGRTFAGCFYHAENLNSIGQEFLRRLCRNITQSITTPSLVIKANAARINQIYQETRASAIAQNGGSVASNAQLDQLTRAIADILRTGGTTPNAIIDAIEADNLDHLLKANLPTSPATDIAANSALGHIMGTTDMSSFRRATDSLESIRDGADTGYANVINLLGEGGHTYTAEAATEPGDNVSLMGGLRYVSDTFKSTGCMGGRKTQKDITFTNLAVAAGLFTVTGDVIVKIIATCTINLTSAGGCNAEVGIAADPNAIIATTDVLDIDAGEIWHDASPDSAIEALSTIREYIIIGGADIIITPSAQIDGGALTIYCFWTPLNSSGNVVAA